MRKIVLFFLVLAVVSVVSASIFAFAVLMRMERKNVPPDIALKNTVGIDFVETGDLSAAGPNWRLVYEEPGSPALTTALIFSEESLCGEAAACAEGLFTAGDRVVIEGMRTGEGSVLVVRLIYVK